MAQLNPQQQQVLSAAYKILTLNTLTRAQREQVMVALQARLQAIPVATAYPCR